MNPTMYNKFIVVSKIILEHPLWKQLDYIIRINSSTFLNCKELPKIFKQLPSKNCYGGRPLETFPYTPAPDPVKSFSPAGVSGMYTFFTPDSLLKLVEKGITNSGNNDDVVLGRTMFELGVPRTLINDYLCNIDDLNNLDDTTKYEKALESTL
jgi:hypothetical protein